MNEWGVVVVIIALAGLLTAVIKPIISLNTTITKLTYVVDRLQKDFAGFGDKNTEAHRRLWEKTKEHDETLQDHGYRIASIEDK